MKAEAIRALEQFKQMHLAREVETSVSNLTNEQTDMVSESSSQPKENQMAIQRNIEVREEPTKQNGKSFNYPDHIAPLKQRIMSALANGARSVESVARYCKEEEKLINLQLNRWVSRGMIGKKITPSSGMVRYYPHDLSKQMGILTEPQPINRMGKKAKGIEKKRSSSYQSPAPTTQLTQAEAFVLRGEATKSQLASKDYIAFLEKRVVEWQNEARKLANENEDLKAKLSQAQVMLIEARKTRDVTSEVTEVMQEVMQLRGTVAYLESKLFGSK